MNNELDVLDQVESMSGKKDKTNLLKAASSDKKLAELLDATFNFKRKFFIKKLENIIVIRYNGDVLSFAVDDELSLCRALLAEVESIFS